jgi:molecular chaperone GrpE
MAENTEHQNKDAEKDENMPEPAKRQDEGGEAALEDEHRGGAGFSSPGEFLNAELERVETEKAQLQQQVLRLAADMENLRKRTQKDVVDARNYSISGFAREMLAVSDNLRRALDAVQPEAREQADESFSALIEGVELTERVMLQALEKSGVKRISPKNERFDPHFHQAMFEIQNAEVPNNTVLDVVQEGYVIGERVLRPAMVGVSRGGPRQRPRNEAEPQDAGGEPGDAPGEKTEIDR